MITCKACGSFEKQVKDHKPTYEVEDCPHKDLDRRGSSKHTVMIYCKQCCTHIDARSRKEADEADAISRKITTAITQQQQAANKILDERRLTKGPTRSLC